MPLIIEIPSGLPPSTPPPAGAGADVLRITDTPGGPPILDFADGVNYSYVPDSLTVDITGMSTGAGLILDQATGYTTQPDERYGGSIVDFDKRANAILQWRSVIIATAQKPAVTLLAQLAAEVERSFPPRTRFVEWRRNGATASLYYERRGPGIWSIAERWESGEVIVVDVQVPVAPVAYGAPVTETLAAQAPPNVWTLPNPGGTLPALMDVQLETDDQLAWGLLAACGGPFGVYEAEATTMGGGFAAATDANCRSGSKAHSTGGGAPSIQITFDPSLVALDSLQYEQDVTVEVWARVYASPVGVQAVASMFATTSDGAVICYPLEYGPAGKSLAARSTVGWQLTRLGTFRIPPDPGDWTIGIEFSNTPSTEFDVDYLLLTPGRWRACGPTGVANDSTYPVFAPAGTYYKLVRSDLSTMGGTSAPPSHFDRGLGGSPLRCPVVADPSLIVAVSAAVPDDTDPGGPADGLVGSVTPTVTLTPRYLLADST